MTDLTMTDTDLTAMLTHAHQDALRTGHCHWCLMIPIISKHVVTTYNHAADCKLSDTIREEE